MTDEKGAVITDLSRQGGADLDISTRADLLADLQPLVVRTVRLVGGSGSAVAEDAAQEALLEMTRSLPQLKNVAAAPAWAMRIATRVALRTAKREARLSLIGVWAVRAPEAIAGDTSVEMLELKEAFDQLPPKLRATAVLRLHIGFSEAEAAAALGCSIGTVKSQLHEARRRLSRQLQGSGVRRTMAVASPAPDCSRGG